MSITAITLLLCLGAATGIIAGLLGIGGGMIMVPFLSILFTAYQFPSELSLQMAIATSMSTILFTSISSVYAQQKKKMIRWDIVLALIPGIIFGGIVGGAKIFTALKGPWLTVFFASFQYFAAYQMLANKKPKASRVLPGKIGLFGTGSLIGSVSSLVGAGGAFISVPFMLWCNVTIHQALATSSALGLPIAAAASVGYIIGGMDVENLPPQSLGYIYLPAMLCIAVTSMLTASIGVRIAHKLNTIQLRKIFAFVLLFIATYMLCKNVFKII